jgi:hypothetical protein
LKRRIFHQISKYYQPKINWMMQSF